MQFEQASIKVQQEKEFYELKGLIDSAFQPGNTERFLSLLRRRGIRVRDFERVLDQRVLDQLEGACRRAESAKHLYNRLALSDQAQIKEFYLFRVEDLAPELRSKFHKLYQYY